MISQCFSIKFLCLFIYFSPSRNACGGNIFELMGKGLLDNMEKPDADPIGTIRPTLHLFEKTNMMPESTKYCGDYNYEPTSLTLFGKAEVRKRFSERLFSDSDESRFTIVTHGFKGKLCGDSNAEWRAPLINNLVNAAKVNDKVIFLDWSDGAKSTAVSPYLKAAANTRAVGKGIAEFLINLGSFYQHISFNATKLHCIGFSLGAHVCGFLCKRLSKVGIQVKCGHITGLDPAGPGFDKVEAIDRLSRDDADFVDIYHSSTLGITFPFGHTDFFLNKLDEAQPSCSSSLASGGFGPCNHESAVKYYGHSVARGRSDDNCFQTDACSCKSETSEGDSDNAAETLCPDNCLVRAGYFTDRNYREGKSVQLPRPANCIVPTMTA